MNGLVDGYPAGADKPIMIFDILILRKEHLPFALAEILTTLHTICSSGNLRDKYFVVSIADFKIWRVAGAMVGNRR
jgi:hypothetical protein